MKAVIIGTLCLLLTLEGMAQTEGISINATGNNPDASAMLDIQSPDKGLLIPRMDSSSRQAILNPAEGLMVYDSTTQSFWYHHIEWQEIDGGSDNLGNHRALQNLQLNGHWLSQDGDSEGIFVDSLGKIGLGTDSPAERLDVNGAIKLGDTDSSHTGTVRWNPHTQDFEGYRGDRWVSLTYGNDYTVSGAFDAQNQDKLFPTDGAAGDQFGASVAISGSYAIVGAWQDDDNGSQSGSAYIFSYDGSSWTQQAKLVANDGTSSDLFGSSVALSGNYAIVGANGYNSRSGAAYIFFYDGTSWTQQAKLMASNGYGGVFDEFGSSVALSGDYAIIGAYKDDDKGSQSGSAYIFHYDGSSWIQQTQLTASDGSTGDYFGAAVSISGNHAIVGARRNSDSANWSGAAYIFSYDGSSWTQQAKLTALDQAASDFFGSSVAILGNKAIIGALGNDNNGLSTGSAYIFSYDGSSWTQQAKLAATDGADFDSFGKSVAISGNYAIVGAYRDDDHGSESGSAYIFHYNGSNWDQEAKLTALDGAVDDYFGVSVAILGDHAIVGARRDDDNGGNSGSTYYYSSSGAIALYSDQLLIDGIGSVDLGGLADNLGDHIATQSLDMNGQDLLNGDTLMAQAFIGNGTGLTNVPTEIRQGTDGNTYNLRPRNEGATVGNARGEYSVDFQTTRLNASEVASGDYSSITGGYRNQASGDFSVVMGGSNNLALGINASVAGVNNVANGNFAAIPGGRDLIADSYGEMVVGIYNQSSGGNPSTPTPTDPVFVVGNGTSTAPGNRSNALTVLKNGAVGIGTNSPSRAKLEIIGVGASQTNTFAYLDYNSGISTGVWTAPRDYSIWASSHIAATEFHAISDRRVKDIIGRSDASADLQALMNIQVTDYTFKDTIAKGSRPMKKVIAQEVAKVYPQAVHTSTTEVVPDIYQRAEVQDDWIMLATDLKVGERVKLITEEGAKVYGVSKVEADRFQVSGLLVSPPASRSKAVPPLFVYGREVDDFHTVDYEALSMLNLSATQEQQRRIEALEAANKAMQWENTALKAQLQALQSMEHRLQALEAQLQVGGNHASGRVNP